MKSVKQAATSPELKLIGALKAYKLKFEKNAYAVKVIKSKPDIVFRNQKLAVYVDGCFWHSCPYHGTQPRSNSESWSEKLRANVHRDEANTQALREHGWRVIRLWSHQNPMEMLRTVKAALRAG
jgi:DNA mismatch endonuclease (patch repair protein)